MKYFFRNLLYNFKIKNKNPQIKINSTKEINHTSELINLLSRAIKQKSEEIKILQEEKKKDEENLKKIKEKVLKEIESKDINYLKTNKFKINVTNSYYAKIIDEDKLPEEYIRITKYPNKTLLKNDLKLKKISGAELQNNKSISVKKININS